MKNRWLNLVLSLTNRIYAVKQRMIERTGAGGVIDILGLIILEIVLAVVSLPLYVGLRAGRVTAFLEEKGGYGKIAFDYNLRRLLTLTGVGIFLFIWLVKLSLIIVTPSVAGPMRLYDVSGLRPLSAAVNEAVVGAGMQTAKLSLALPSPVIEGVKKTTAGNYDFSGTGRPFSSVIFFLSDQRTMIYTADVGADGRWSVEHNQKNYHLSEGNHSIIAFTYDKNAGQRSLVSAEQFFKVQPSTFEQLVKNIDTLANWSVTVIIALGLVLTFLTV